MTPQAPIIQTPSHPVISETEAMTYRGDDYRKVVREIFLRQFVSGEIKKNEEQNILTSAVITDVTDDRNIMQYNQDTEHFAASINKLPVVLLVLEDLRSGKLKLNKTIRWTADDRRAGLGNFDQQDAPLRASLKDVLYDLLNRSGNTAVRVLVNESLGGAQAVNERLALEPRLAHTRLKPLDANRFYMGNSTPTDSLWVLSQLVSDNNKDKYTSLIKEAMATNIFTDFGVRSQLGDSNYVFLINKVGLLDDSEGNNRHDVGIIYNKKTHKMFGYSFFTTAPYSAGNITATQRAEASLKDMGRQTLWFSGSKTPSAEGPGTPEQQAKRSVEQRLLY